MSFRAQAPAIATTYRLASAQVVTSTVLPPVLKLSANGPIAFQVLPADANGAPVGPDRVVARLFGIAPGDLASSGDLAPFALTATAEASANGMDTDTIVTIATGAVSCHFRSEARLACGHEGQRDRSGDRPGPVAFSL